MKIKKLFHWLYAILMLLPVFFIAGRCLYVTFNKNAKDSYSGETTYEINYKYQSNDVNTASDLVKGNIYEFKNINGAYVSDLINWGESGFIYIKPLTSFSFIYFNFDDSYVDTLNFGTINTITIGYDDYWNISIAVNEDSEFYYQIDLVEVYFSSDNLVFQLIDFSNIDSLIFEDGMGIFYTDYNEIESVDIDNTGTLDNAFIYSVYEINETPLFSWAKTSFLVAPFAYIGDLFGIAAENPIITLLSYWLSISIVWLVFDLVMYLPLLIHKWIDKGVVD